MFLALYGYHSFFPLSGQSKKQTVVSHSTVEAEILAADHALRTTGCRPYRFGLMNRPLQLDCTKPTKRLAVSLPRAERQRCDT